MNAFVELTENEEKIGKQIVNACYRVHKELGPGMLEKVYEVCLMDELRAAGLFVARQIEFPIFYRGNQLSDNLRIDLIV